MKGAGSLRVGVGGGGVSWGRGGGLGRWGEVVRRSLDNQG